MGDYPVFSVIIPVYNAEKVISKCVLSVLNQTFSDYELILINDGSTDTSNIVIEEIIKKFPQKKIRLLNQENCGAGETRNHGIEYAKGEFIAFLDADDYWDELFLEETAKVINKKGADLVYVDIVRERENGTVIRFEKMSSYSALDKETIIRWQLTGKIPWGGVRKVIKRSLLLDHNIRYATTIKVGEESVYSYKALYYSHKFSFQSTALYHYVDNGSSLTSNDTVDNSLRVYDFIRDSFNRGEIDSEYEQSIRALGITTMAVITNVLSQQQGVFEASRNAKQVYRKYRKEYRGQIDKSALETRVLICAPWICIGMALPVVLAGKIQKIIRGNE